MTEQLLTPEEAAERLLVKAKTVREWLKSGKIKGVKMGRLWRIKLKDLDEFIEDNSK